MQTDAGSGASLVSIPFPPLSCLERLLGRMVRERTGRVWTVTRSGVPESVPEAPRIHPVVSHSLWPCGASTDGATRVGERGGKRSGAPRDEASRARFKLLVQLLFITPTSDQARLPAEFKHITKRQEKKLTRIPLVTASEAGRAQHRIPHPSDAGNCGVWDVCCGRVFGSPSPLDSGLLPSAGVRPLQAPASAALDCPRSRVV